MLDSKQLEKALIERCGWYRTTLIPECAIPYPTGICRADFLWIPQSRYATEFEIKTSTKDWEHDRKKAKWRHPLASFISKFIYVIPYELPIPAWVDSRFGIWKVSDNGTISVERNALWLSREKVSDELMIQLSKGLHYRYWTTRMALLKFLNAS